MTEQDPSVSVVVATYAPGDGVLRVIDSLDAQTMPQDRFEVLFIDDGSPDDTHERLQQFAATRPNISIIRIENSGWPSKPRNLGIDAARGEYVLFMDHDDALYPDALRRGYEYARETDADVVNVMEYNNKQVWWMPKLAGNIPNALTAGGIDRLMPFMPHKLYRRQVLLDHHIRFPERPRALWEDWYVNIDIYRHAKVVSMLADTPFYQRHIHDSNASLTFNPAREDYWERLDDVMRHIIATLDGPEFREARTVAVARHMIARVLPPLAKLSTAPDAEAAALPIAHARTMLARYGSDAVFGKMSKSHRAQAYLLQTGDRDLIAAFHAADKEQRSQATVQEIEWRDGVLVGQIEYTWEPAGDTPILRREGERIFRAVPPEVAAVLPSTLLDVTKEARKLGISLRVRNRSDFVSWDVPYSLTSGAYEEDADGRLRLVARGEFSIDVRKAAFGGPMSADAWDLRSRTTWMGMARPGSPTYDGGAAPMMHDGGVAVAYANNSHGLSLDLAQKLRTFALDAGPRSGPAGPVTGFSAPLENVSVAGRTARADAGMLYALPLAEADAPTPEGTTPEQTQERLEALAEHGHLAAEVVADADGARLVGGAELGAGRYRVHTRLDGTLRRTKQTLTVDDAGQVSFD